MLTMFILLRLIKFSRLRHAFWYFFLIAILSKLLQSLPNSFFTLSFRNPLDLSCVQLNLFFPLMMLPMGNFMSAITQWMHRPVALGIIIASLMELDDGIVVMGVFLMGLMLAEVARKGVTVIGRTI